MASSTINPTRLIDLTQMDSDSGSESETVAPSTAGRLTARGPAAGTNAIRSEERSMPIYRPQRKPADEALRTPGTSRTSNLFVTPPTSQHTQRDQHDKLHQQRRRRGRSESPSAARAANKRAKARDAGPATPPSTAEGARNLEPSADAAMQSASPPDPSDTPRHGTAPTSPQTPLQPTPVARRTVYQDGHVAVDASVFSPKPFKWEEWSAKDYLQLSDALDQCFDATKFAKQLSAIPGHRIVTTEEVAWMFCAVVSRPLRLVECSRQRGREGMQELREYVEKHGTEIRWWGRGRVIRGELLGLDAGGVVLALVTTPYGKQEQDARRKAAGESLIIDHHSGEANMSLRLLSEDDVLYLKGVLSDKDLAVFEEWAEEIAAERRLAAAKRKGKGRAATSAAADMAALQ